MILRYGRMVYVEQSETLVAQVPPSLRISLTEVDE